MVVKESSVACCCCFFAKPKSANLTTHGDGSGSVAVGPLLFDEREEDEDDEDEVSIIDADLCLGEDTADDEADDALSSWNMSDVDDSNKFSGLISRWAIL